MGQCFAILSPGFNPSFDPSAVTGVLHWPCRNDDDCSLNGKCSASGRCKCRPAWKGERCETLNLLKPDRSAGYRGVDNGHNTSSWGGAVLKGENPNRNPSPHFKPNRKAVRTENTICGLRR